MKRENENLEFRLHQSCENNVSYWVNATAFERMWNRDKNGTYLAQWNAQPRSNFFSLYQDVDEIAFLTPCVQVILDNNSIFVHTRPDRVRWLLENVVGDEIPVAIYRDQGIEKSGTGLILRRVQTGDVIRLKNDFDPSQIIAEKLAQRASIRDGMFDRLFQRQRGDEIGVEG